MNVSLFILSLLALATAASAQSHIQHTHTVVDVPKSEPREHQIDMMRMRLEVRFEPQVGKVLGRVTHVFKTLRKGIDSIEFDAVNIHISQALLSGKPVRTRSTDSTVIVYCEPSITWDVMDSIQFVYDAQPRKGIYFVGWNDPSNRLRKQIWTQGQAIDNRAWIPMYDEMNDKYLTETVISFDSSYQVLSNGTKLSVEQVADGTKKWHYTMTHPHAPYLLMIAIGKYDITQRTSRSGVPLYLYSYPDRADQIESSYRYSAEAIDFMESELGVPYPWESYSQIPVSDFIFGAMENTTATIFGDFMLSDARSFLDRNYFSVNVHELTHQWFGDYITARASKHAWLQESFATFYPHLYTRVLYGNDAYEWSKRGQHNSALAAGETDRLPIVHPTAGNARIYPKGAAVIDMMRYVFGEEQVRRVITHYLRHHSYQNVETNDLYLSFQDTLGITPDWFFKQWLYQGGEPHYKVSYTTQPQFTTITVGQIHPVDNLTGYFTMPVVFDVYYTDGTRDTLREWVRSEVTTVTVPNRKGKLVSFVLFDPGSNIMKKISFDKSFAELSAQVRNALHVIDRYDALVALGKDTLHRAEKVDIMSTIMDKETLPSIRAEAVRQVAEMATPEARRIFLKALADNHLEVRSAALASVQHPLATDEQLRKALEPLLQDSSYAMVANALAKLVAWYPAEAKSYLQRTANEHGPHERVRIAWLEASYALGDTSVSSELIDKASASWEFRTRQNAFDAIKRLNLVTPASAKAMLEAITNPNERLAGSAKGALDILKVQIKNSEVLQSQKTVMEQQLTGWRLERLKAYQL